MDQKTRFKIGLYLRALICAAAVVVSWFIMDHTFGWLLGDKPHDYLLVFFSAAAGAITALVTCRLRMGFVSEPLF
ncbi:MAG TPA: hypothetical protein VKW08_08090 [Xanthobacteraceae bacterium]|jgi:hypothetical protein|nr:hypothetical protein [Xanthobacteraceae bacterium]